MCACMRACVRASVRCLMLPNAKFVGNPSGSVTASSFAFFVSECYGKHAREVLRIPMDQSLVLILDTGGGCLLHLNAHVLRAAMNEMEHPLVLSAGIWHACLNALRSKIPPGHGV